jgi:uncharacterized protein YbjT (DUF2867 family)
MLRIESRHDGTPLVVEVRSLTAALDEGERVLNISWHQPTNWLAEALQGASVVVDVSNSPSFEDEPVMEFFTTSTTNQLAAEADAGVRHHVALSIVGTDRLTESGYIRAKIAQEKLITESAIPYSIVDATQFFEFATRHRG